MLEGSQLSLGRSRGSSYKGDTMSHIDIPKENLLLRGKGGEMWAEKGNGSEVEMVEKGQDAAEKLQGVHPCPRPERFYSFLLRVRRALTLNANINPSHMHQS